MSSPEDLPAIVERLLEEREMSLRRLGQLTRDRGWGSIQTVHEVVRKGAPPTRQAMEAIAAVLEVKPETFPEYRLLRARESLDPATVGLEAALRNLDELPAVSGSRLSDQERAELAAAFVRAVEREADRQTR